MTAQPRFRNTCAMLRDFATRDQVAVRRLILGGLRERWGNSFDSSYNSDLADIASNYLARGAEVVVVEHEDEIVATGMLLQERGVRGRIVRVSVTPAKRRHGLAKMVVLELCERGRRRGYRAIDVLTDTPWVSAVALYRSCGFEELRSDGSDTHFVLNLGGSLPTVGVRPRNVRIRPPGAQP